MRTAASWIVLAIAILPGSALAQDKLGRLFFTPAERTSLDNQRRIALDELNRPVRKEREPDLPKAPPPKMFTLNGVVRRSDGETTIWVNNQAAHDGFRDMDVLPGSISREAVAVQLPGSGRRVKLKVGQTVDSMTGRVEESYRRRQEVEEPAGSPANAGEPPMPAPAGVPPKPRKSKLRDDDATAPPAPAKESARAGSEGDGTAPEYR